MLVKNNGNHIIRLLTDKGVVEIAPKTEKEVPNKVYEAVKVTFPYLIPVEVKIAAEPKEIKVKKDGKENKKQGK